MNDQEYIRQAVELADGWEFEIHANSVSSCIRTPCELCRDYHTEICPKLRELFEGE